MSSGAPGGSDLLPLFASDIRLTGTPRSDLAAALAHPPTAVDPGAVRQLASRFLAVGELLDRTLDDLARVADAATTGWHGPAGEAFAAAVRAGSSPRWRAVGVRCRGFARSLLRYAEACERSAGPIRTTFDRVQAAAAVLARAEQTSSVDRPVFARPLAASTMALSLEERQAIEAVQAYASARGEWILARYACVTELEHAADDDLRDPFGLHLAIRRIAGGAGMVSTGASMVSLAVMAAVPPAAAVWGGAAIVAQSGAGLQLAGDLVARFGYGDDDVTDVDLTFDAAACVPVVGVASAGIKSLRVVKATRSVATGTRVAGAELKTVARRAVTLPTAPQVVPRTVSGRLQFVVVRGADTTAGLTIAEGGAAVRAQPSPAMTIGRLTLGRAMQGRVPPPRDPVADVLTMGVQPQPPQR